MIRKARNLSVRAAQWSRLEGIIRVISIRYISAESFSVKSTEKCALLLLLLLLWWWWCWINIYTSGVYVFVLFIIGPALLSLHIKKLKCIELNWIELSIVKGQIISLIFNLTILIFYIIHTAPILTINISTNRLTYKIQLYIVNAFVGDYINHHHHHHHVPEGLGMLSCSLILKMKLVPPPLPWSSRVPSSFRSIL